MEDSFHGENDDEICCWFVCLTCYAAFNKEVLLGIHKLDVHGIPRRSRAALMFTKEELQPVVLLSRISTSTIASSSSPSEGMYFDLKSRPLTPIIHNHRKSRSTTERKIPIISANDRYPDQENETKPPVRIGSVCVKLEHDHISNKVKTEYLMGAGETGRRNDSPEPTGIALSDQLNYQNLNYKDLRGLDLSKLIHFSPVKREPQLNIKDDDDPMFYNPCYAEYNSHLDGYDFDDTEITAHRTETISSPSPVIRTPNENANESTRRRGGDDAGGQAQDAIQNPTFELSPICENSESSKRKQTFKCIDDSISTDECEQENRNPSEYQGRLRQRGKRPNYGLESSGTDSTADNEEDPDFTSSTKSTFLVGIRTSKETRITRHSLPLRHTSRLGPLPVAHLIRSATAGPDTKNRICCSRCNRDFKNSAVFSQHNCQVKKTRFRSVRVRRSETKRKLRQHRKRPNYGLKSSGTSDDNQSGSLSDNEEDDPDFSSPSTDSTFSDDNPSSRKRRSCTSPRISSVGPSSISVGHLTRPTFTVTKDHLRIRCTRCNRYFNNASTCFQHNCQIIRVPNCSTEVLDGKVAQVTCCGRQYRTAAAFHEHLLCNRTQVVGVEAAHKIKDTVHLKIVQNEQRDLPPRPETISDGTPVTVTVEDSTTTATPGPGHATPQKKSIRIINCQFSCKICKQGFKSYSAVLRHKSNFHGHSSVYERYCCRICKNTFMTLDEYFGHTHTMAEFTTAFQPTQLQHVQNTSTINTT